MEDGPTTGTDDDQTLVALASVRAIGCAMVTGKTVEDFRVTISVLDGEVTALLAGRLTAALVAISAQQILQPIEQGRTREVIVDGSQLTYCMALASASL